MSLFPHEEKLRYIDFHNLIKPLCNKCYVAKNCNGCFSPHCPFFLEITNMLHHACKVEECLNDAIKLADFYNEIDTQMQWRGLSRYIA